ncbi:hypothetical protein THAOC_04147 [Thalassiosira oceanica]|uniref:Uncharacterized protein n=1 Tax=Thalassiosira oceanica TaxID=159749 RepID=K0T9M9_THAOC|nr:hypothetical protein THAOC_04147 [Thalassiosira oceanica]|eukprot:EJK74190.1 hypothetical protein THAOC_04147 [Thalassiosira oceanica]
MVVNRTAMVQNRYPQRTICGRAGGWFDVDVKELAAVDDPIAIANYHASSARPAVVDAAEAEENTPAGSLAENPGETERSAAEFGGAPRSGQRPRGQTEARRPRRPRLDKGWGEASYAPGFRIREGTLPPPPRLPLRLVMMRLVMSLSAEGNYKEEMQEMTRWFETSALT